MGCQATELRRRIMVIWNGKVAEQTLEQLLQSAREK